MGYSVSQGLFRDLFFEALGFMKCDRGDVRVLFERFECPRFPNQYQSGTYLWPVQADFGRREVVVHSDWIEAVVADKLPTVLRSQAYYYAYGFYVYDAHRTSIEHYPMNQDAVAFAYGLLLLNGVPIDIPPFMDTANVIRQLSRFSKKDYVIGRSVSPDGRQGTCLSLSYAESKRIISQLNVFDRAARLRKLDIRFGTKEHPFANIDEAIKYIDFLESEAVASDEFLNSSYNRDPYRYDIAEAYINGHQSIAGIYKIPWASAYTAHAENPFPGNSFIVTQLNPSDDDREWLMDRKPGTFMPLFGLKPNLSRRRFLFRGQYEEFEHEGRPTCKPNIYRPDVEKHPLPHRIKAYEMACLVTRHPLVQQLGVEGVKIFNEPFRFQLNRLGLAQHYYNKTSYLDLTSDIEVARFFATCQYRWDDDTYTPYFSDDKLGVIYIYDMRLPFEFKSGSLPQLSSIGKQYVFMRSALQSGFLLNMPPDTNLHDLPNVYRIYFRHDRSISEKVAEATGYGEKYFPKDALSQHWRTMYKAPNDRYTISIKAREMYLRLHPGEYKSMAELDQALIADSFRLGTNQWPAFPDSILEEYRANAPELWKQFCRDIYFTGSEGLFMKAALEELIR